MDGPGAMMLHAEIARFLGHSTWVILSHFVVNCKRKE